MSPAHRRYLLLEQGVGAGVVNFVLNAGIAALMFRGATTVPLWGQQSIAGDTIGTTFLLPLITCLIVTPLAQRQMRAGALSALGWTRSSHPVLGWLPRRTFPRGLALGVICVVLAAPVSIWALGALQVTAMSFGRFVLCKAAFAAVLGAVVTPVIALWAIAEAQSTERSQG
jgi:hypothetical protein